MEKLTRENRRPTEAERRGRIRHGSTEAERHHEAQAQKARRTAFAGKASRQGQQRTDRVIRYYEDAPAGTPWTFPYRKATNAEAAPDRPVQAVRPAREREDGAADAGHEPLLGRRHRGRDRDDDGGHPGVRRVRPGGAAPAGRSGRLLRVGRRRRLPAHLDDAGLQARVPRRRQAADVPASPPTSTCSASRSTTSGSSRRTRSTRTAGLARRSSRRSASGTASRSARSTARASP